MIPKKLEEEITRWVNEKRYGSLQINFQGGKIVNVNRNESLKVDAIGLIVTSTTLTSVPNRNSIDPKSDN